MAESKIEWTDRSDWNPIRGCTRVSPGCGGPGDHGGCYAEAIAARFSGPGQPFHGYAERTAKGGRWTGKVEVQWDRIELPLRWRKPAMIFASSTSDFFHVALALEDVATLFGVMIAAHHVRGHTFQVLTKRADIMRGALNDPMFWEIANSVAGAHVMELVDPLDRRSDDARATCDEYGPENPPPGIWLGVSVEDQARADERIPELLATPAAVRFLSCEPLLGPVDLRGYVHHIPGERRSWESWNWPSWVPTKAREQIENFWRADYGRGLDAWMIGARNNKQPPLGAVGDYSLCTNVPKTVRGRFIPAWNNIGRVVDVNGDLHTVSSRGYASRTAHVDWVIAGGESGPNARPMHPDWARRLRDQCAAAGVPFHFKQWGEHIAHPAPGAKWKDGSPVPADLQPVTFERIGKKRAGRLLDGVEHNGLPGSAAA